MTLPSHHRDAFGRLLTDPDRLPHAGRVEALRVAAGTLQAAAQVEARWLGRTLSSWLHRGGDLPTLLGVRPPPGSHATPQQAVRQAERDRLLLRLSTVLGGDAQAVRALASVAACPARHVELRGECVAAGCPTSRAAFGRARRRASRAGS